MTDILLQRLAGHPLLGVEFFRLRPQLCPRFLAVLSQIIADIALDAFLPLLFSFRRERCLLLLAEVIEAQFLYLQFDHMTLRDELGRVAVISGIVHITRQLGDHRVHNAFQNILSVKGGQHRVLRGLRPRAHGAQRHDQSRHDCQHFLVHDSSFLNKPTDRLMAYYLTAYAGFARNAVKFTVQTQPSAPRFARLFPCFSTSSGFRPGLPL